MQLRLDLCQCRTEGQAEEARHQGITLFTPFTLHNYGHIAMGKHALVSSGVIRFSKYSRISVRRFSCLGVKSTYM